MSAELPLLRNGQRLPLREVPELPIREFREAILRRIHEGDRLACLCADFDLRLVAVLAEDAGQALRVLSTKLDAPRYPALTPDCPQAHLFEREIAEQTGIVPEGHPWLKPVRFHLPWNGASDPWQRDGALVPGVMDFFRVEGEEVHEVAVGPVHAGVIEPGHFRFQCHGERVFHLEIALGYQHRGVEKALLGGPHPLSLKQAETACGDSSIAHAWAYCRLLEGLADVQVPARVDLVRGVALELERVANHVGDLGALSGDVGFLPTASFCGRIRGDWLNLSAEGCGSRLGRDWLRPGGLRQELEPALAARMRPRLEHAWADTKDAVELLWGAASVMIRFEAAGRVDPDRAREIGLVGVPARASGLGRDVRHDHPFGPYGTRPIPVAQAESGNVHSRAWVRWVEVGESTRFLSTALASLAESEAAPKAAPLPPLAPEHLCVSLTEGWRGEVLHLAWTDAQGRFARYKIVDPSFHNWFGLALALRGEQVSDFPLCNKSFNLSYCGHDL
ncbi:NADH-quinone oxidoreductase subunit C [Geothrix edaphica]|uniref:Hydrogenase n=1 Tax=Geothrix edaphica TaxID=2927976 RepID=A0ABQ5Q1Q6_9BACT|nr:NADH-quinone oxidoreductase subunit C [Geothrix edaphica]GLH68346.1 hydrogenase [Geothrix edaphica]